MKRGGPGYGEKRTGDGEKRAEGEEKRTGDGEKPAGGEEKRTRGFGHPPGPVMPPNCARPPGGERVSLMSSCSSVELLSFATRRTLV
ncbi:hypothetical protein TPA0910_59680 [Streptomyces hygroscopicus subsp. sporocinereus]|uniref:Uncharacterized protein n=1 Tax=Streptomyces hygroscopicus TaxID=1912 RepID=A0ABQ3U7F8_STRHY|nr:hypothetical protein TPA0910_59680 [Streptomyces hygroscopicus]